MSNRDNLGNRMKSYEDSYRISIPPRMPIILRIDGKAFHTYTKSLVRPVDENLTYVMNETAKYLCKNIQGCQVGYIQSDEISLLLNNYNKLDTQPWFENNLQKMVSISAGMASAFFTIQSARLFGSPKLATFDSRAFILPKEDVNNYFLWRQQDATRNSVQMLARSLYSHKDLNKKNNAELQELCFQKGINWNDCPVSQKRGRCIVKVEHVSLRDPAIIQRRDGTFGPPPNFKYETIRKTWEVDNDIPIFSADKNYIEKYVI